jgi:hypothetical protein
MRKQYVSGHAFSGVRTRFDEGWKRGRHDTAMTGREL